ncbi:unnamed protein product [Coffea canephora]|uniref:Nucleotide-diphospho-sugar transferase domain-containing protein n=1 Tax=Coffea canephora TaxID=49390 RepID=A0A068UG87_COFCA|nr:unnamed protein product [Coffea canephora]
MVSNLPPKLSIYVIGSTYDKLVLWVLLFEDLVWIYEELYELNRVLQKAATMNRTVIMTTLNEAWAAKDSIFDLFIESFKIGNQTEGLLKHLLVIALDQKAYARCLKSKLHCYSLRTDGIDFSGEAYFMSADYLKMMWRRVQFLTKVLDMGYNFLFSDADIMWFRDPFPHFYPDADFQIACDYFRGNPSDIENAPNGGFTYVKSNNKTRQFYRFWHDSRILYPKYHDQDVLNKIKRDPCIQQMGLKIKFFDTAYIGGFCEPSRDLNKVCTMHANCCAGLENKVHDLKIMLEDWRKYMKLSESNRSDHSWTVPQLCGYALPNYSGIRLISLKGGVANFFFSFFVIICSLASFGRHRSTNKTSEGT